MHEKPKLAKQPVLKLALLMIVMFVSGCATQWVAPSGAPIAVAKDYKETQVSGDIGYLEFFVIQDFGFFRKLEEGPASVDSHEIYFQDKLVGRTHVPQWPMEMRKRAIADSFSVTLVPLPAGSHKVRIKLGPDELQHTFDVKNGHITLVRLESIKTQVKHGATAVTVSFLPTKVIVADTHIPIPRNPAKLDLDNNATDAITQLLHADDWGLRWYATRMIRTSKINTARDELRKIEEREKHKDVRYEIAKAIKVLD